MATVTQHAGIDGQAQHRDYNYEHFRTKHFVADVQQTSRGGGIQPGAEAPDFELTSTEGERVRLSSLRGRPVVLHFGSVT
jgi:cytochrome oxidase Cu insertion factor (SCO1/SenC/PrrC family)